MADTRRKKRSALEVARLRWEHEDWGEPRDEEQQRLWTLFWTDQAPDELHVFKTWTRPQRWIEELIRA